MKNVKFLQDHELMTISGGQLSGYYGEMGARVMVGPNGNSPNILMLLARIFLCCPKGGRATPGRVVGGYG